MDSSGSKLTNSVSLIITTFLAFTTLYFLLKGHGMTTLEDGKISGGSTAAYTLGYIIFIVLVF